MPNSLQNFSDKLKASPALRHQVLADALSVLEKHGVNIHDATVIKALGLDKAIGAGGINPVASSIIITITA